MKITASLLTFSNSPDMDGDVFARNCFGELKDVPVTINFDSRNIIGVTHPYFKDNKLMAEIEIIDGKLPLSDNLEYGIGYQVLQRNGNYIDKLKLYEVSVQPKK